MRTKLLLLIVLSLTNLTLFAKQSQDTITYKTVGERKLNMIKIEAEKPSKKSPTALFFFGGGWAGGKIDQLRPQAEMLAKLGITCFLVDYRVRSKDKVTTPDECIKDAKSAIRYVREHAKELGIDPDKIIASGASAGGHLAAAAAYIDEFNTEDDNLKISCIPNALVLFNPVTDCSPEGYYPKPLQSHKDWKSISPLHHITKTSPPVIFLVGDKDKFIPVASAKAFESAVIKTGAECKLVIYPNVGHTFFNYKESGNEYFDLTMQETINFLTKLGYIR